MARILLIEPDRLLADTYRAALKSDGHTVTICSGAQAGIMAADEMKPELVILELQLVEHSGIEFLYEFRSYEDWRSIPLIVHSHIPPGEFESSKQILKDELAVSSYLYKPQTSLQKLRNEVDEQLVVQKHEASAN